VDLCAKVPRGSYPRANARQSTEVGQIDGIRRGVAKRMGESGGVIRCDTLEHFIWDLRDGVLELLKREIVP